MRVRLFTMAAVGAMMLIGSSVNAQAAETLTGKAILVKQSPAPAAPSTSQGVGIYITSTTIGDATPGAPCYFCGPSGSIAIPYPLVAIPGGTPYYTTVQLQSVSYTGVPTVKITMFEDGNVIAAGSVSFTSAFEPGYVGYAYFTGTLPTTTGVVTIDSAVTSETGVKLAPGAARFSIY